LATGSCGGWRSERDGAYRAAAICVKNSGAHGGRDIDAYHGSYDIERRKRSTCHRLLLLAKQLSTLKSNERSPPCRRVANASGIHCARSA
jgi:hypothetical protein